MRVASWRHFREKRPAYGAADLDVDLESRLRQTIEYRAAMRRENGRRRRPARDETANVKVEPVSWRSMKRACMKHHTIPWLEIPTDNVMALSLGLDIRYLTEQALAGWSTGAPVIIEIETADRVGGGASTLEEALGHEELGDLVRAADELQRRFARRRIQGDPDRAKGAENDIVMMPGRTLHRPGAFQEPHILHQ